MFNPLKGLGDLNQLRQQAQKIQQQLQQEEVSVEKDGISVLIRGDQKVLSIVIDGVEENRVAEAINEAIKKSQDLAAKKLINLNQ
jgi:DNA-binding protein YbaB